MAYAFKQDGAWQEITGSFTIDATQYPPGWADMVTNEERMAIGVLRIVEPDPAPDDVAVTGWTLTGGDIPTRA